MRKEGKKYQAAAKLVDKPTYTLADAMPVVKRAAFAKFDETVEVALRLGVDPKHADQMVRGTVVLPHGLGKSKRVVVIASGDKVREGREAGADESGGDDLVQRIQGGWMDFDAVVATPDMMKSVGRLGKILGPRGLMPNPKLGTVTPNVAQAVKDAKGGQVEFRADKTGNVNAGIGKMSFSEEALVANVSAFLDAIQRARPSGVKGTYIKKVTLSSTMGPGVKIDTSSFGSAVPAAAE